MIEWKKFNDQTESTEVIEHKQYLIFNGSIHYGHAERLGSYLNWYTDGERIKFVTYYAEINLP